MSYTPTRTTTQVYMTNNTIAYTDYVKGTSAYAEAKAAKDDDGGEMLEELHDIFKFSLEVSFTSPSHPNRRRWPHQPYA